MTVRLNSSLRIFQGVCFTVVLALGLGACAPSTSLKDPHQTNQSAFSQGKNGFAYGTAQATIREGLKNITKRYIDPIPMDILAVSGLQGLATLDPRLSVDFDAKAYQLKLSLSDTVLKTFSTPHKLDAAAWAFLATKVIRTTRTYSQDIKSSESERVFEAFFDGMMSNLDIFSRYAGGNEARTIRAQRDGFGGIGITFKKAKDGILITHVDQDSPANLAGIKLNDLIFEIDGIAQASKSHRQATEILHGPVGSLVAVSVLRKPRHLTAELRRIDFNLLRSHIIPQTVFSSHTKKILTLTISSFNKSTSTSLHNVLRAHEDDFDKRTIEGVILDLRGNPGGLLSQSVNVADLFLKGGRIISTRGRHIDSMHNYTAGGLDLIKGLPLVVLVDGNSASAAEIVASALQDLGRAVVVGTSSYGKGTVQTVIRLPNDGEMTLTWSRLISPSGYALHGLGVMPAVCVTNYKALHGESMSDAILSPAHIKKQREDMGRWWAAGMIFDGQRPQLRTACPAKILKANASSDLLEQLAIRVISDQNLYQNTLVTPDRVDTALRH